MSFLLDTNVVSEMRKGARADARLRAWLESADPQDLHLSVLVTGELRRGVELARKRDAAQAVALDRWLNRLVTAHGSRILPVDQAVAEQWGRLMSVRPGSVIDTLMAATALVHRLVLVTRNVKDVAWTGVSFLNPFEA